MQYRWGLAMRWAALPCWAAFLGGCHASAGPYVGVAVVDTVSVLPDEPDTPVDETASPPKRARKPRATLVPLLGVEAGAGMGPLKLNSAFSYRPGAPPGNNLAFFLMGEPGFAVKGDDVWGGGGFGIGASWAGNRRGLSGSLWGAGTYFPECDQDNSWFFAGVVGVRLAPGAVEIYGAPKVGVAPAGCDIGRPPDINL
jgi:hypothetical protein